MDFSQLLSQVPLAWTHWKRSWFTLNWFVSIQHATCGWINQKLFFDHVRDLTVDAVCTKCQAPPLSLLLCSLHLYSTQLCAQVNWIDTFKCIKRFFLLFFFFFKNGFHHNFFIFFISEHSVFRSESLLVFCCFCCSTLIKMSWVFEAIFSQIAFLMGLADTELVLLIKVRTNFWKQSSCPGCLKTIRFFSSKL